MKVSIQYQNQFTLQGKNPGDTGTTSQKGKDIKSDPEGISWVASATSCD